MFTRYMAALACGTLLSLSSFADSWDKKTFLTVREPIQVSGTTLAPGKYVLKLVESLSDRHIVRILNENEEEVITTVLAIPNWRLQPSGKPEFTFWETPAGNPPALRAWFYPGDNFGQEFVYPKKLAVRIAAQTAGPVPSIDEEPVALSTSPITPVDMPRPEPGLWVQADATPAQPESPPAATLPEQLPATGSFAPVLLLIGVVSTGSGLLLRSLLNAR